MEDAPYSEWADRLEDPDLPGAAAYWYAAHGTLVQQLYLTGHAALPQDAAVLMATEGSPEVRRALAFEDVTSTYVLELLAQHDDADFEAIAGNWNAPVVRKLDLLLWKHTRRSIEKFYEAVRASPEERAELDHLHNTLGDRSRRTLGDAWTQIRHA